MVRVNIFIATIKVILIRNMMDVYFILFSVIYVYTYLHIQYKCIVCDCTYIWRALAQWFNSLLMLNTCARHLNRSVIWLPHYTHARQYLKRKFSELCVQISPTVYLEEQCSTHSVLVQQSVRFSVFTEWSDSLFWRQSSKKLKTVKHKSACTILIVIVLTRPLQKCTIVAIVYKIP